jgi:urease accessory protein
MSTLTHTEASHEVGSTHLRAFTLPSYDRTIRLALVPEQAVLLAGDHVEVTVRVGRGRALEIVEPGGTVAYAMRGSAARWDVTVEVEDGGSLIWHGEPFVVSEGANVTRRLAVDLATDTTLVLRETLVLGRTGEGPGQLLARTDVRRDGLPVLVEELDTRAGLGQHRVLDQVLHLGPSCAAHPAHTMTLESGDLLHRWLGDSTHASPVRQCSVYPRQSSPSAE